MILTCYNTYTEVESFDEYEIQWLTEFLSYQEPDEHVTLRGGRRKRIEKPKQTLVNCFSAKPTFPTGLIRHVMTAARKAGVDVTIDDHRSRPCKLDRSALPSDYLWEHQMDSFEAINKHKRGLLNIATGGGKGTIAAFIPLAFPCLWTFIVPEAHLLWNLVKRFKQMIPGAHIGKFGDNHCEFSEEINVCTFQTLRSKAKHKHVRYLFENSEGIVVDEAHMGGAPSNFNTLQNFTGAFYRIGLSGTPLDRADDRNKHIIGALGPIIQKVGVRYLTDKGILTKAEIEMIQFRHSVKGQHYNTVEKRAIVDNVKRNELIVDLAERSVGPTVVFTTKLKHLRNLEKMMKARGISCATLQGSDPTDVRDETLDRMTAGEYKVVIATKVLQTGIDIPSLRTLIVASSTKSNIAITQTLGRGLRKFEGKEKVKVYDISDVDTGGPAGPSKVAWFERHARHRYGKYLSAGHNVRKTSVFESLHETEP